jgi:hypothetical protein
MILAIGGSTPAMKRAHASSEARFIATRAGTRLKRKRSPTYLSQREADQLWLTKKRYVGTTRERAYAGAACASGEKMRAPRAITSSKPTAR